MPLAVARVQGDVVDSTVSDLAADPFAIFEQGAASGAPKKYALIVNADGSERHLLNVAQSTQALKDSGYETIVVSTLPPREACDHYFIYSPATEKRVLAGMHRLVDKNDDLVIYYTGHGSQNDKTQATVKRLDGIPYGQRTVVIDQCYGGDWGQFFSDDPNTYFVSAGSPGETVNCQEFSPAFWGNVPDANQNGRVSFPERYAFAAQRSESALPQAALTTGYGQGDFPHHTVEVGTADQMQTLLQGLHPGQYATVMFSASWCGPCRTYKPHFDRMATEAQGQYLFLRTESESLAASYGITAFPTVVVFDQHGTPIPVQDQDNLLYELSHIELRSDRRWETLQRNLQVSDPETRGRAAAYLKVLMEDTGSEQQFAAAVALAFSLLRTETSSDVVRVLAGKNLATDDFFALFHDPSEVARRNACLVVPEISRSLFGNDVRILQGIRSCLRDDSPLVRAEAILAFYDINRWHGCGIDTREDAEVIFGALTDPYPHIRHNAALALSTCAEFLAVEQIESVATALRDEWTVAANDLVATLESIGGYIRLLDKLSAQELVRGAEASRLYPLSEPGGSCTNSLMSLHGQIIAHLPTEHRRREIESSRIFLGLYVDGPSPPPGLSAFRFDLSEVYVGTLRYLSGAALEGEAAFIRSQLAGVHPAVLKSAITAYRRINHKLDPASAELGRQAIQGLLDDPDVGVRQEAQEFLERR